DLHWIDSETQALLDGLVEVIGAARLLLLVSYRPEYAHAWGSRSYYTQLRLDLLPPPRAQELVDALVGQHAELAPLKQVLIERGNRSSWGRRSGRWWRPTCSMVRGAAIA